MSVTVDTSERKTIEHYADFVSASDNLSIAISVLKRDHATSLHDDQLQALIATRDFVLDGTRAPKTFAPSFDECIRALSLTSYDLVNATYVAEPFRDQLVELRRVFDF